MQELYREPLYEPKNVSNNRKVQTFRNNLEINHNISRKVITLTSTFIRNPLT